MDGAAAGNHSRTYSYVANGWYSLTTPVVTGFTSPTYSCGAIANIHSTTVNWTASTGGIGGVAGYEYSIHYPIGGGSYSDWTTFKLGTSHSGALNEGISTLKVRAKDNAGNYSGYSNNCTITADWTAPLVTIDSPLNGDVLNGVVSIYGTVTDNIMLDHYNIAIYPGDADFMDFSKRLEQETVYLTDNIYDQLIYEWDTSGYPAGKYLIRLAARDKAGNRDLSGDPNAGGDDSQHVITVYVGQGYVHGGGQIINDLVTRIKTDDLKISFGGWIWDVGDAGYKGDWEVNFHNINFVNWPDFTYKKFHAEEILGIKYFNPGVNEDTCYEAVNFVAKGKLDNNTEAWMIFRAGDYGAPGNWTDESFDTVRISIFDDAVTNNTSVSGDLYDTLSDFGGDSSCVGTARTTLDYGNVTIWKR